MQTRRLFEDLGFERDWTVRGGELPGFLMRFGPHIIEAMECRNRWLQPVFTLGGVINTGRTLALIESEMGLEIDSREEGLALLGFILGRAVPQDLKPEWLTEGERLKRHLPWERERVRERLRDERRPRCRVDREWFRIAGKRLRSIADEAGEGHLSTFSFDGEVLRIRGEGLMIALPGTGNIWPVRAQIATSALRHLPRRLMDQTIEVVVLDDALRIAGRQFALARQTELVGPGTIEASQSAPLSRLEELVRRPFAELSEAEKKEMGQLNEARADKEAQAIVDNLNRHTLQHGHGDRPSEVSLTMQSFAEIEGRPVAKGVSNGRGYAFVWDEFWRPARGLVGKAGSTLSQSELQREFPGAFADMSELSRLAKDPPSAAFE